eukprot:10094698-Alexandrium_andersonii.AAC.1
MAVWTRLATSLRLAAQRLLRSLALGFSARPAASSAPGHVEKKVRCASCLWGPAGPSRCEAPRMWSS